MKKCCCCCNNEDEKEEIDNLPLKDGVIDFRQNHGCCRDFYCLIVFALVIVAMIVIFAFGFTYGDPRKLYYPVDTEFVF
jgi:hypothetical protein